MQNPSKNLIAHLMKYRTRIHVHSSLRRHMRWTVSTRLSPSARFLSHHILVGYQCIRNHCTAPSCRVPRLNNLRVQEIGLSERRACKLLGLDRSSHRYEASPILMMSYAGNWSSWQAENLWVPAIACLADAARVRGECEASLPAAHRCASHRQPW